MSLDEFVKQYLKDNNLKLLPHQKGILKAIEQGKMTYDYGNMPKGISVLGDALNAYKNRRKEDDK